MKTRPFTEFDLSQVIDWFANGASGVIVKLQTTFLEIVLDEPSEHRGKRLRIRYLDKADYNLQRGKIDSLSISSDHPLAIEFTQPHNTMFFNSMPQDPKAFLEDLSLAADQTFQGWRSIERFLNGMPDPVKLVTKGSGLLLTGPKVLTREIEKVAQKHGVHLTVLAGKEPETIGVKVLLMGGNYIVAQDFTAEIL